MKKSLIVTVVIIIAIAIFFIARNQFSDLYGSSSGQIFSDEKNSAFIIDNEKVRLIDGKAVLSITPNSASQNTYKYFGNSATGDLDGDRRPEIAFLITKDTGGSGLFYYAVVATRHKDGYRSLNTIFIGDRIAPQSTQIQSGVLTVNYADRNEGEPFTTSPSIGKSLKLTISKGKLVEVNN
jgi:hypothetical protein